MPCHEDIWWGRGLAPSIFKLSNRFRQAVSFISRLLFPLCLRLGGPQNWCAHNIRTRGRGDCDPAAGQGVKSWLLTFQHVACEICNMIGKLKVFCTAYCWRHRVQRKCKLPVRSCSEFTKSYDQKVYPYDFLFKMYISYCQVWHACTATECRTLLLEESGLHLRYCPLNLAKDTTTSIQIQRWTRRGKTIQLSCFVKSVLK